MLKWIVINIESLVSIIISISDIAVSSCSYKTHVISFYMSKIELYMGKLDFWHVNDITCVWLLQSVTAISDIDIMMLSSDSMLMYSAWTFSFKVISIIVCNFKYTWKT